VCYFRLVSVIISSPLSFIIFLVFFFIGIFNGVWLGYTERAVAILQAMIEFNCFCPPAFEEQSFFQRVDLFEVFWDSECRRFGEEGAVGWRLNITGSKFSDA
jgi:hypothetical protein